MLKKQIDNKVFCISMQRTGTTSVGKFLRDFNFKPAGWPIDKKNDWSGSWYKGDFEKIFSSEDFLLFNAFEDSPWFFPDFYKVLFHRFPNSKFILFVRDSNDWFDSMVKHSNNNIIGRSKIHCKIYRRELEYFDLLDSGLIDEEKENQYFFSKTMKLKDCNKIMKLTDCIEHYKKVYRTHNIEVHNFFQQYSPKSLHIGKLEDVDKWQKLGKFLNVEVPTDYNCHENKSKIA